MKKFLATALIPILLIALFACSRTRFYSEEEEYRDWLQEHTAGYSRLTTSRRMILTESGARFRIQINIGSSNLPQLQITDNTTSVTVSEPSVLTVRIGETLYAEGTAAAIDFNPYQNQYDSAMKVYQKDETHFRIFFALYGDGTDFYPIPRLLTEKQYQDLLALVTEYTETQRKKSDEAGDEPINYTEDFLKLYSGTYTSELAENPKGTIFYQYTGEASNYLSDYRELMLKMGISEQEWRRSFEDLGYTGFYPNRILLYADLTVEDSGVFLTLHPEDGYQSSKVKTARYQFSYAFCPSLQEASFVTISK